MDKLQEQGWFLTEQGYNIISDCGSVTDTQKLLKRACDTDLREIGSGQGDITRGNVVLQIQKLRNIAAPKSNEESRSAPRMLKLSLTDGKNNFQAVEIEKISNLSLDTPPGTKILLKSGEITLIHGIVLLAPSNIAKVLGGKVTNLVEKWELNRKLATHSRLRSVEEGGPPPWIPFGKKIMKGGIVEADKSFKALGGSKDATDKETTEFEAQRQDAIAEAARLGGKKIFGGGNKQLLDHSVQKIVDQGFSVEQAEYALKMSRNNVDRALKSLQRTSENRSSGGPRETREPREVRPKRFEKKPEETKPSSGKVSLFDFLEDKLPAQSDVPENSQQPQHFQHHHQQQQQQQRSIESSSNYRLENHFERLEMRGSEYSQAGKGGRAQKGGRGHQTMPRHVSDETKYPKRSSTESYNPFAPSSNTFGNSHQGKPPRFQRNQEVHGNHHQQQQQQQENVFKSQNYVRSSQTNERKGVPPFGQSRSEAGVVTNADSSGSHGNKNHREEHRGMSKNNQHIERYQDQQASSEQPKMKHESAGHARHNRALQQDRGINREHGAPNANEKNSRNQNRPQQLAATNVSESNNYGNSRNSDYESAGGNWVWKAGDDCMAKYWEDNRYYNAEVTAVSARTCVVLFKDFNNYEEVLQVDCIPITDKHEGVTSAQSETRRGDDRGYGSRASRYDQSDNHISAGMEFRRGGGGGGGNAGLKGYNRKRGQQRSAQAIYQPPAQRGHSSVTWTARNNPPL